ncbi:MAG: hypothetical protein ABSH41_25505 [Syntrophobacteraceae bacterium]|jgi:hypothetical protein
MKRIVILLHEHQRLETSYLLDALRIEWQKRGLTVSSVNGIRRIDTDLVFPHIDLTFTPPRFARYLQTLPAVVNRNVLDISKRSFSTLQLSGKENYRGPVIVKTDKNAGGSPEYNLFHSRYPGIARRWQKILLKSEKVLGQFACRRQLGKYPIFESLEDVPAGVFRNRALVVEKFLPEKEGDRYFIRHYLFLGDRARSVRVAGPEPFLKRQGCTSIDEGCTVPEEVISLRRRLGLDYGKIDYTLHDGRAAILDINRTMFGPGTPDATARTVGDLVDGIWSLFPK